MISHLNPARFNNISELVPHSGSMLLIDGITSYSEDSIEAFVNQDGRSVFTDDEGDIPGWFGIEYMAQAVSAYAGIFAKSNGEPIRKGFLLGTRKYQSRVSKFKKGWTLNVHAKRELIEDGGVCIFDCEITHNSSILASASIKAIQPEDVEIIFDR